MLAIMSMMRISRVEISNKSICRTERNFEKFENTVKLIYTMCAMLERVIYTMFVILSMMRITGVEISKKSKCAKKTANSKSLKTL